MTKLRLTGLLLAGALAAAGCGGNDRDADEVVPAGAIPAPPEGIDAGTARPDAEANHPSGTQLEGEPPLQGSGGLPADTPSSTSPAVPPQ